MTDEEEEEEERLIACDTCDGDLPATVYVSVDDQHNDDRSSDELYLCPHCVGRFRRIVGACSLAAEAKPPDDPPAGAAHVMLDPLVNVGDDLEWWNVCRVHARQLSRLRIRPPVLSN